MGFFETCEPQYRFTIDDYPIPYGQNKTARNVYDWDQRRRISIVTSWKENDDDFLFESLIEHLDDLPADMTVVEVGQDGEPTFWTTHTDEDKLLVPFYPKVTEYPPQVRILHRSQLYEIERKGIQVDHAAYHPEGSDTTLQHVAFKYYFSAMNMRIIWHEANCLIRIPEHPGIVGLHSLVVDRIRGEDVDRVVGFTTPYTHGGTIEENVSRLFKLKHLTQLFEAIDYLNLQLGIVHGDIHMRNILMDQATDQLKIFDFNWAARLGWEGEPGDRNSFAYDPNRNDVKDTIFAVYEIITRDTHFRDENTADETDTSMVTEIPIWVAHGDVHLETDSVEYRKLLQDWVQARAETDKVVKHYTDTPLSLNWPALPKYDRVWDSGDWARTPSRLRQSLIRYGESFLSWQRPPSSELPLSEGRSLLVTGETVIDGPPASTMKDIPRERTLEEANST